MGRELEDPGLEQGDGGQAGLCRSAAPYAGWVGRGSDVVVEMAAVIKVGSGFSRQKGALSRMLGGERS